MCCSVLHCDALCSVLQCVVVCCSVVQCVAVCCNVLQCVAVCCSVLQHVAVCCSDGMIPPPSVPICVTRPIHMCAVTHLHETPYMHIHGNICIRIYVDVSVYGVASLCRLLTIIGLFCKRAL